MSDTDDTDDTGAGGRAAALRDEFDRGFAHPPRARESAAAQVLRLRVAGLAHAVRLSEVLLLDAGAVVVPVPSASPELLGVAGLRVGVVPVYDLARLLGYPGGGPARWLLVARASELVGFACEHVEGLVGATPGQLGLVEPGAERERPGVCGVLREAGVATPLLDLGALVATLEARAKTLNTVKDG